ncbi:MAG TPA: metallophosphoesterase [Acidimicrobiia bacterium]|nr:metallophosphoesterase [Acidimicrobiia bacterium]
MLIVSDVHGAFEPLAELARGAEPVLVLGDLLNLMDYRTGDGITADLLGRDTAMRIARARALGDFGGMRAIWAEEIGTDRDDFRRRFEQQAVSQYEEMRRVLDGTTGFATFGNVDRPDQLRDHLPAGWRFVDGEVIEVDGWRVGIVGGGIATPLGAAGEVSDEEMTEKLGRIGPVDILCSHLPPAIRSMHFDVVTGRPERASQPILDYIVEHQPRYHYYGDVHQPQASTWRIGATRCRNVGYFRATRRAVRHEPRSASTGAG